MKKGSDNCESIFITSCQIRPHYSNRLRYQRVPRRLKALSASPQGVVESKYNSDKEGTSLTSQLATEDVVPINLLEHIYLVTTNDVAVISNDGKETKLKQGSFVLIK